MSEKQIKAKILGMIYESEDYIFIMDVLDIDTNDKISFAMRIEDFGITRKVKMPDGEIQDVPVEMLEKFCRDMIGQERNLTIEQDNYKGYNSKPSKAEAEQFQKDMDKFPYKELIRKKLNED